MTALSDFINLYFLPGLVVGCIYALGAIGISLCDFRSSALFAS